MSTLLPTTLAAIEAILRADPAADAITRRVYRRVLRTPVDSLAQTLRGNSVPASVPALVSSATECRLLRRAEAARRLGCSVRSVDKWSRTGILRKIALPGRKRKAGIPLADVERLINGPTDSQGEQL